MSVSIYSLLRKMDSPSSYFIITTNAKILNNVDKLNISQHSISILFLHSFSFFYLGAHLYFLTISDLLYLEMITIYTSLVTANASVVTVYTSQRIRTPDTKHKLQLIWRNNKCFHDMIIYFIVFYKEHTFLLLRSLQNQYVGYIRKMFSKCKLMDILKFTFRRRIYSISYICSVNKV